VDKLRVFFNHPGFIGPMTENVQTALRKIRRSSRTRAGDLYGTQRSHVHAEGSRYVPQLRKAAA